MRKRLVVCLFPIVAAMLGAGLAACNSRDAHLTARGDELSSEFASENAPMQAPESASLPPVDLPVVGGSSSAAR
jgi:uncharacterized lipoprotein